MNLGGLKLGFLSKLIILSFVFLLSWWSYLQLLGTTEGALNYGFAFAYGLLPLFGGLYGLLSFNRLKKTSPYLAKSCFLFSLGLFFWGVGELIWSYYNLVLNVAVPYPSLADAAFILAPPLWTFGVLYMARGVGIHPPVKNTFAKALMLLIPACVLIASYYLIFVVVKGGVWDLPSSPVKAFFDISYPLWDAVILAVILVVDALALGTVKNKFSIPFLLISLGIVFIFLADIGISYQTTVGTFYNGGLVDLLYATSVFLLTLGVTVMSEGDESPTIQSLLLRQREEEIKEVNQKLQERDQMMSRINQEMYKKNLELFEEKKKAEALLYNIAESVVVLNKESKIKIFNHAAQNLIGRQEDSSINYLWDDVVTILDHSGTKITFDEIKGYLENQDGLKFTNLTLKAGDGKERYVTLTASKVSAEEDQFYVVIISDVTEQIKTEKAREEFISIASHELRTPMTIIKNYLWMLQNKKGGALTDKQGEYVGKALSGTERMIKLIRDMLDISRMEQGKYELHIKEVDLTALVNEVVSDFKIRADQKGLDLKIKFPKNLPKVSSDEDKLREIIINLVGNSFKFTDSGFVSIGAIEEGNFVKVEVKDSGKGISKEDLPKLFNKFGRLDNSYVTVAESGGTGLGLYITKSIVETLGGQVGAESDGVGKGAKFWFTLPKAEFAKPQADSGQLQDKNTSLITKQASVN